VPPPSFAPKGASPRPFVLAFVLAGVVLATGLGGAVSSDVGGGLFTYGSVQHAKAVSSVIHSCAGAGSPNFTLDGCGEPTGVAYVAATQELVVTSYQAVNSGGGPDTGTGDYVWVLNASTLQPLSELPVTCLPEDPFYPGVGSYYFVPCQGGNYSQPRGQILELSVGTNLVVRNLSIPGYLPLLSANGLLTWDPGSSLLYSCNTRTGALDIIDPASGSVTTSPVLPNGCSSIAFDPASDSLLEWGGSSPGGSGLTGIDELSPSNGSVLGSILAGVQVDSLVATATGTSVAVGTTQSAPSANGGETGLVIVLNAANFEQTASYTLGSTPNIVTIPGQMLWDPIHGDLYAVTNGGDVAVNATTGAILTTVPSGGGYFTGPAAFDVATNSVVAEADVLGFHGYLSVVAFSYSSTIEVTSLFWLAPPTFVLLLAPTIGVVVGAIAVVRSRRSLSPRQG
jgi:hypothetical protein